MNANKTNIVVSIEKIIENVMNDVKVEINFYKINSLDKYDFWEEHIKYVYNESIKLANLYNADLNVVKLGALLHDIALIKKIGDRKDHHLNGATLAREILNKYDIGSDIKEKVIGCVLNHRSSKNATNLEELCVADADVLAHFDNIPMLFNSAYNICNVSLNDVKEWMKKCFEDDYNDLSDKTKEIFNQRYKNILDIVLGIGGEEI